MAVLDPSEYDQSYFDGGVGSYRHNAGYTKYERWRRFDGENSLGEKWKDLANNYKGRWDLVGKKVLDVGCAKGFLVKDLRDMGVDAYGLDVSQYAVDNCEDGMASYLTVGDVRTALTSYKNNEFDIVYSRRLFECLPIDDIQDVLDEMKRIGKYNLHIIQETPNPTFYHAHPISWWEDTFSWPSPHQLISLEEEWNLIRQ